MEVASKGIRKIAVRADEDLSESTVERIRKLAANLQSFANKTLATSLGVHSGHLLRDELEDPYEKCSDIIEELENV